MDNSNKYIGNIKSKGDKIKIIPGEKDDRILFKRNKILGHLDKVLSGGKRLKEKNIPKYFQALGGKYIRNDICSTGDLNNCKGGKNATISGAHKLLKLVSKKNLPIDNALESFKGSAPKLYKKLETKIKGGYNAITYDTNGGGGKIVDSISSLLDKEIGVGINYDEYFTNSKSDNNREKLINEISTLKSSDLVTRANAVVYLAALEGEYYRLKLCDSDVQQKFKVTNSESCHNSDKIKKKISEIVIATKSMIDKISGTKENSLALFKDKAPNIYCHAYPNKCNNKGGNEYYEREYDNRGGDNYYERNYDDKGGGDNYYERDYYNRGGRDNYYQRDYYPNEMHGGHLGEFRNEIGRHIEISTNLRQDILNIEL